MPPDSKKPAPDDTPQDKNRQNPSDTSTTEHEGVHSATPDDPVQSRSADPGQSSYGGFKDEDPRKQAQDIDSAEKKGDEIAQTISGHQPHKR